MTPTTPLPRSIPVRCPACGEMTEYGPHNPNRPFCSARCRGHDFGAWANEQFRVEAKPSDETADPDV